MKFFYLNHSHIQLSYLRQPHNKRYTNGNPDTCGPKEAEGGGATPEALESFSPPERRVQSENFKLVHGTNCDQLSNG